MNVGIAECTAQPHLVGMLLLCVQSAYDAFMKTQPELEAFEAELKKYMAIETEVTNISPVYNIGEQAVHSAAVEVLAFASLWLQGELGKKLCMP